MSAMMWLVMGAVVAGFGATEEPEAKGPTKVVIVTGMDIAAHDWKTTAPAVKAAIEAGGEVSATIVEDPEFLASEELSEYEVVVLHFRNEKPLAKDEAARRNLTRFVEQGGGLVVVHFANGAFGDWDGFARIAGRVWDKVNTHDPRGEFVVRIVSQEHPVTRGMKDFQADDELYIGLAGDREVELLAVSKSKVTGRDHPMAFVFQEGKGRVFHTPLGHDVKAIQMPGVSELLRRGTLWVAGRLP